MSRLLHVVPGSASRAAKLFAGSTKDVLGRREYFQSRHVPVEKLESPERSDTEVLNWLRSNDPSNYRVVLFEYEVYSNSMAYLRRSCPGTAILMRSHNSNLPHFLDQFRGRARIVSDGAALPYVAPSEDAAEALRRFQLDAQCARLADYVLPITSWETDHYWAKLTAKDKVVTVPYFVPNCMGENVVITDKSDTIVFMMGAGGLMTPLLYDAGRNAVDIVNALPGSVAKRWQFLMTGKIKPADLFGRLGRIEPTGLLDSPLSIIAGARAVAILSDLGMGFKTKLLEAAMAGCWLIVTPALMKRIPKCLRPWCLPVATNSPAQFARQLERIAREPPPSQDPNALLRDEAFQALDRILGPIMYPSADVRNIEDAMRKSC